MIRMTPIPRRNTATTGPRTPQRSSAASGTAAASSRRRSRPVRPATPGKLFDAAEEQFGPVDILVNNATGWLADTFATVTTDRLGRSIQPVPPQPGPGSSPSTRWVRP